MSPLQRVKENNSKRIAAHEICIKALSSASPVTIVPWNLKKRLYQRGGDDDSNGLLSDIRTDLIWEPYYHKMLIF